MSTRWYPIYQKGSPQLRVFLPNFWLKLVKPVHEQPPNVVQFACSMQMTRHDIKNYLEKIYNVKPMDIQTRIAMGRTYRQPHKGYVVKDDDVKYAYITLPKGEKFVFPELYPEDNTAKEEQESTIRQYKENLKDFMEKNKERPNVPAWFTI